MGTLKDSRFAKQHSDSEFFDEVRISTVPRYKTSGMSGDEWRVSAHLELFWKGNKVFERSFRNVETASAFLPSILLTAGEMGDVERPKDANEYCFQPGCCNKSVSEYELIKEFERGGHGWEPNFKLYRKFCQVHLRRGDCGLEDADDNYTVVSGPGPNEAKGWGKYESESM